MRVADSSVAVAGFASWHPQHEAAHDALTIDIGIPAHAAFETYSSLTRLPEPHTMAAAVVRAWLEDTFSDRWLSLSPLALRLGLARLQEAGVSGGATYDGLIALTAAATDATLVTLDRRAVPVYALVGADIEFIGS